MAKTGGKLNQSTPRAGKRLGIKCSGNQKIKTGNIIIRQRGSCFHPGPGTKMGKDYSIFAIKEGRINFKILRETKIVEVI